MSRFFQSIFGGQPQDPPASALRVTTSLQGIPIPIILGGVQRMTLNLIDYYDFASTTSSGGGKGGIGGGGSKGSSGTTYFVIFVGGICEGPVAGFGNNWVNGALNAFSNYGSPEFHLGDYAQLPSGITEADDSDPNHSLTYRGIAYMVSGFNLGSSPNLPQINFEVASQNADTSYFSEVPGGGNIFTGTFGISGGAPDVFAGFGEGEIFGTPATGTGGNPNNFVPGQPDGDPSIAFSSFLTNPYWGLGFPPLRLGPLAGSPSSWQSYCKALGFGVSPVIASSVQASAAMGDLVDATNSAACWQNGLMTVVPYGDQAIAQGSLVEISETHIIPANIPYIWPYIIVGNVGLFVQDDGVVFFGSGNPLTLVPYPPVNSGTYSQSNGIYYFSLVDVSNTVIISYTYATAASYVPDNVPLYDFTISDILANQGTIGTGLSQDKTPVLIVRKPRDQMLNDIKVEYLDRNNAYNPVDIEVKDSAAIVTFGRLRPSDIKQYHFFCLASAAVQSATLQLVREQVARTFQFTVGKHFTMILQLMKIVTITLPGLGLVRQPVRLIEIQENTDQTLTLTAEEYPGTVAAPIYGTEAAVGAQPNWNADPGTVNAPVIFEPTDELGRALISGGGLMVVLGISGATDFWGGAQVWTSYDGNQYTRAGTLTGSSRMGVLTAQLPGAVANTTGGQTIDNTSTLSVNLTESSGTLNSVSQIDANSLNTKSFIGPTIGQPNAGNGEIIAYQNATLTSQNNYNLTYLVRGAYGSEDEIAVWPAGTSFLRIDDGVLAIPFDKSRIGSTLFIKLTSFNVYGGALQSLAAVQEYSYTLQGLALASPLPTLTNVATVFQAGRLYVTWDEITDFRGAIRVEIRQGSSYDSALILGTVAHPPYALPGNGTYWFTAWCQPAAALIVRSEFPVSVTAAGATIVTNSVASFDCKAAGWPGTFVNAGVDSGIDAVRVNGGQIMTSAPTVAGSNVLNFTLVPAQITAGMTVTDLADSGVIPAGTTVVSVTTTTVTMSNPVGADFAPGDFSPSDFGSRGVLTGDIIQFSTGEILDTTGTYQPAFTLNVGRVMPVTITISVTGTGLAVGQNILGDTNILGDADVLGSVGSQFVDVFPSLLISQDGITYAPAVKYAPGDYVGMAFMVVFTLTTVDPNTIPYLLEAVINAQVPARVDHVLTNQPLSAAGLTVQFTPDGSNTPAPFNGGPNGATVPHILATWGDEQAGDVFSISNLTLAGATFQIVNSGIGVTRSHVNILAEGF